VLTAGSIKAVQLEQSKSSVQALVKEIAQLSTNNFCQLA
jgi:hypothetical protein